MRITTWKKLLVEEMDVHDESWEHDIVHSSIPMERYNDAFDPGYGSTWGCPFTLWTAKRVYFPVGYDGKESVASVPRYPSPECTSHIGQ